MACCSFIAKYLLEAEIKIMCSNVLVFKYLITDTWTSLSCWPGKIYFIDCIKWCLWTIVSLDVSLFISISN